MVIPTGTLYIRRLFGFFFLQVQELIILYHVNIKGKGKVEDGGTIPDQHKLNNRFFGVIPFSGFISAHVLNPK